MTVQAGEPEPIPYFGDSRRGDGEYDDHEKRSGQILWIRGLTRLQTQVRFVFFMILGKKNQKISIFFYLIRKILKQIKYRKRFFDAQFRLSVIFSIMNGRLLFENVDFKVRRFFD